MPVLSGSDIDIKVTTTGDTSGIKQVEQALGGLEEKTSKTQRLMQAFGASMKAATPFALGMVGAFGGIGAMAIKSAADMEQAKVAFTTMLGSADLAGKKLAEISDFARKTPFELPQVVQGAKQLLAYGIEADKLIPTFTNLGNIAAGVGMDKLPNLILAFGQVKAATKLTGAELRQFTEAGVPLLDELAKMMGVTAGDIQDMVSKGLIGFPLVEQALKNLTGEGGRFDAMMEKQSKTLSGTISNLKDNLGRLLRSIVGITEEGTVREGSIFDLMAKGATKLLQALDAAMPSITSFFNWITSHKEVMVGIAGALAGLATLAIIPLATAFITALPALIAFSTVGAGIALLAMLIIKNWEPISSFFSNIWQSIVNAFNITAETLRSLVQKVIDFFLDLPKNIQTALYNLFFVDIPYMIGFIYGFLTTWVPQIVNDVIRWFEQLPSNVSKFFKDIYNSITQKITDAGNWLATELPTWPGKISAYIKSIPDKVSAVFESAKKAVLGKMEEIWKGVTEWWNKIVDKLKGLVDWGQKAWESITKAFKAGVEGGKEAGRRQFGGPVMERLPYIVGERGPELFVPNQSGFILPSNVLNALANLGNQLGIVVHQTNNIYSDIDMDMAIRDLAFAIATR